MPEIFEWVYETSLMRYSGNDDQGNDDPGNDQSNYDSGREWLHITWFELVAIKLNSRESMKKIDQ